MNLQNKSANKFPKKNLIPETDFKKDINGLASPLTAYGNVTYSISDEAYIAGTKSQRIQYTSSTNAGGNLNRGFRLILSDKMYSNLKQGKPYVLTFYGKGMEDYTYISLYTYGVTFTSLPKKTLENGWYRYAFSITLSATASNSIYIRPNNNQDYTFDCLINALQIEEGPVATNFETYEEISKTAKKVAASKNLIPNFNDAGWFQDDTAPGGAMEVDSSNPYKMKLTLTASAQSRIIHIPVQKGKAYTFSFANIVGLYRLYRGKVLHHELAYTLVQDASPVKFTFVVDSSYNGYVTLRLTNGSAGVYTFENLQLEEGYANTSFGPYQGASKQASLVPKKNLFHYRFKAPTNAATQEVQGTKVIVTSTNGIYRFNTTEDIPVKPNTMYNLSYFAETLEGTAKPLISIRRGSTKAQMVGNGYDGDTQVSFNTGSETSIFMYIYAAGGTDEKTVITYDRVMLVEGSKQDFEPYELTSKRTVTVKKAPYLNYPFKFQRESVEILDGIQYGLNSPRIKDNGILIEEGTINLYTGDSVIGTNFSYINQDGWKKVTNVAAGVGATASMGLRNRVDLSKITNGLTYSCSATVYNPHDYAVDVLQDWCDVGQSNLYTTTILPKETKKISVTASRSLYDATYRFYDIAPQGNGNTVWIKEIQVENKTYPTSYTSTERKADTGVSKTLGVIDNVEGTIEFTYIPSANQAELKGNGRTYFSVGQGQNFRVWNWGNGDTHVINFDMTSATGTRQYFDYIPSTDFLKKDVPVTFKITWDSAWINLFVNGEKLIYKNISSGGGYNSVVTTQPLYIGTNNTEVLPMPGIYKDITITDRNKKVIFQL